MDEILRPSLGSIYDGPRPYPYVMHRWHHYVPIYERYFERFRGRPINMLEIGVQYGGGLWMWHKYFHPASRIYGVDVNPSCTVPYLPNVSVAIGDQADPEFWARHLPTIGAPLDIVIDDGGHTMNQQINAFEAIYPTMADDGVYLVEDTHTSLYGDEFFDRPQDKKTFMQHAHSQTLQLMDWSGRRENFNALMTNPASLDQQASEFCRTTQAIHFHDSIVVYERGLRLAPGHALR